MMNAAYFLVLAALLGIGTYVMPKGDEPAAHVQAPAQASQLKNGNALFQQASLPQKYRPVWNRGRDGDRSRKRGSTHLYHHDGYYYRSPWWTVTVPLVVSTPSDFDSAHVEWCLERYRSYNPRDNTWVSYSGRVRECDSPFW